MVSDTNASAVQDAHLIFEQARLTLRRAIERIRKFEVFDDYKDEAKEIERVVSKFTSALAGLAKLEPGILATNQDDEKAQNLRLEEARREILDRLSKAID